MFKHTLLALITLVMGLAIFQSCGGGTTYEEIELPTQGLITTVTEVSAESFRISDETPIPDTSQSLIIANYLDNTSDTFTLAEARLVREGGYGGRSGGVMAAASYGFFGYMLGRSMGSFRPQSSAYTDPKAYNRVNNTTGNTIRSTSQKVRRPTARSRSGYGGGKSTRSYGG